jgi:signal peptidase
VALSLFGLASIALVVLLIVLPSLLGLQRYVITGGSMSGTIAKGSVIYSRLVPVDQLKVGDIITFLPPTFQTPVTHRIIEIKTGPDGSLVYRTKGDANAEADPWEINLGGPNQAVYVMQIPLLGYFLGLLTIRWVRMLFIGIPAVAIAISLLFSLWKQSGEDARAEAGGESPRATRAASPKKGVAAAKGRQVRRVRPINATGRRMADVPRSRLF